MDGGNERGQLSGERRDLSATEELAQGVGIVEPAITEAWNRWSVGLSCATFGVSQSHLGVKNALALVGGGHQG